MKPVLCALSALSIGLAAAWNPTPVLANEPAKARVSFRILDVTNGRPTPAMICLRRKDDDTVRLPPDGRVMREVGKIKAFYDGIAYYAKDPGWIGPVRMMNGKGDNSDRSHAYEDLPSVPHWREPIAHQAKSRFAVELEPGDYRLSVSRGMEFIPIHKDFTVESGRSAEYTIRLERWTDLPKVGWYSGDVHVHHPTLKKSHREFLLSYAEAEDLNVVNVLEMGHHDGTHFKQLGFGREFREIRGNYCLVSGQEDPRGSFGHVLGLNTTKLARDVSTYLFYDLAFDRIHAQKGALVGFAHFSWNGNNLPRGFPWYVSTEALDFIELLQFARINRPDYYDYLNLGFRLTAAAGSDVPWGSTIGECRTYVFTGGKTLDIDAWFDGLRQGHTFVSNGPALFFTVDGELPGSTLKPHASDRLKVHARASGHKAIGLPDRLEIISGEGVVKSVTRDKTTKGDLTLDFEIKAETSGWITASTTCKNGAIAHTTPVYIVVDGRPTWSPTRGPAVIEKQLAAIERIEKEFSRRRSLRDDGIRERLARARAYYSRLLTAMRSSAP
jgi:hypothetical protein